jgi:aromatase
MGGWPGGHRRTLKEEEPMAGHTDNEVTIEAPLDLVWKMANDVISWPELFTEYESTEILRQHGNEVRFRLTMRPDAQGNRWSWVSERVLDLESHVVRARRVETGWFKYMNLFWEFVEGEGGVRMRWVQDFEMKAGAPADDQAMTERLDRNTGIQMRHIKETIERTAGT